MVRVQDSLVILLDGRCPERSKSWVYACNYAAMEATTVLKSDVVWPVGPNSTTLIIHI